MHRELFCHPARPGVDALGVLLLHAGETALKIIISTDDSHGQTMGCGLVRGHLQGRRGGARWPTGLWALQTCKAGGGGAPGRFQRTRFEVMRICDALELVTWRSSRDVPPHPVVKESGGL